MYKSLIKEATEHRDECHKMALESSAAGKNVEATYFMAECRYWEGRIDGINAYKEAQAVEKAFMEQGL